jgi:predicted PhzF superfamily epimerase YddE/YHI9
VVHILQGVEIKRPSHIYVRASKHGQNVDNVRSAVMLHKSWKAQFAFSQGDSPQAS